MGRSSTKELLRREQDLDHAINLIACVVEVEARPRGAWHFELPHERLRAVMAATQGEALGIGELGEVVRMRALERESDERATVRHRAEDAQPFDLAHALQGILRELGVMIEDGLPSDALQVVDGCTEHDGASDVRSACLKARGAILERAAAELDTQDHLAAAMPGRHVRQDRLLHIKRSDACGRTHLVAAQRVEVAVERAHIDRHVACTLGSIEQHLRAYGVGFVDEQLRWVDGAERIRDVDEGQELDLLREQAVNLIEVEHAFVSHRDVFQDGTRLLGEQLPGHQIAVVLHLGGQDHIACLEVRTSPGLGDEVDALCCSAGEDDLFLARIEEGGHLAACGLILIRRTIAQFMQAAMHIRIVTLVVAHESIDHLAGLLRGRGVVEIDERMAVDFLVQDREVLAKLGPVGAHGVRMMAYDRQRATARVSLTQLVKHAQPRHVVKIAVQRQHGSIRVDGGDGDDHVGHLHRDALTRQLPG